MTINTTSTASGFDDGKASQHYIRSIIEEAIAANPRSLQKNIGPSEIGMECDHCLTARLAGWQKIGASNPANVDWIPAIGTAVHAWLQNVFDSYCAEQDAPEFITEQKVCVGRVGGINVYGSTDLYRVGMRGDAGMVIDWKIVGANTLRTARATGMPSKRYEIQAQLYAHGWTLAGHETSHVAIYFLPRNGRTLRDAYWWSAPYNPDIALGALERANRLYTAMQTVYEVKGQAARDKYITSLPRAAGCWDCWRYADWQPQTSLDLGDLLRVPAKPNRI